MSATTIAKAAPRRKLDIGALRRYLHEIEALAQEATITDDPRVLRDALGVLARQHGTIAALLGKPDRAAKGFRSPRP